MLNLFEATKQARALPAGMLAAMKAVSHRCFGGLRCLGVPLGMNGGMSGRTRGCSVFGGQLRFIPNVG